MDGWTARKGMERIVDGIYSFTKDEMDDDDEYNPSHSHSLYVPECVVCELSRLLTLTLFSVKT